MGLIERLFSLVFGGGRNVVAETAEVFRVNADASDARRAEIQSAALAQLAVFQGPFGLHDANAVLELGPEAP